MPSIEEVRIAPGGQRVAYASVAGDLRVINVVSLTGQGEAIVLKVGDSKLRSLEWADDQHLVFTSSVTTGVPPGYIGPRREYLVGYIYDLSSHKLNPLTVDKSVSITSFPEIRIVGGRTKVFFRNAYGALYENDVQSTFTTPVQGEITGQVAGKLINSQIRGALSADLAINAAGENVFVAYLDRDRRWWARIRTTDNLIKNDPLVFPIETPVIAGLGPHGDTVVFSQAPNGEGQFKWAQLSLKTGKWMPAGEIKGDTLIVDPQTGLGLGMITTEEHSTYQFFDPALQRAWTTILKAFSGEQVDYVSSSNDRKKIVVRVFGQRTGSAYLVVDMSNGHADMIGEVYGEVQAQDIQAVKVVTYSAGDGARIMAYLTLPKGRADRKLPLVVLVHGGPDDRDTLTFDWEAQAFASQGYAVLQPEYRGSRGLGEDFREKGFGQWGRLMQSDVSDGVAFLAQQATIDPKRVCIVGSDYGGYAALAGVTIQSGVYRCAVSIAGQSDMERMLAWQRKRFIYSENLLDYYERYLGVKGAGSPELSSIAPIKFVSRATAPILLIHGRDDTVAPIEQSQLMADALKAAGKPVELVLLDHEDHWLSRSATRLQMLQATVKFVEANNPPDPVAK